MVTGPRLTPEEQRRVAQATGTEALTLHDAVELADFNHLLMLRNATNLWTVLGPQNPTARDVALIVGVGVGIIVIATGVGLFALATSGALSASVAGGGGAFAVAVAQPATGVVALTTATGSFAGFGFTTGGVLVSFVSGASLVGGVSIGVGGTITAIAATGVTAALVAAGGTVTLAALREYLEVPSIGIYNPNFHGKIANSIRYASATAGILRSLLSNYGYTGALPQQPPRVDRIFQAAGEHAQRALEWMEYLYRLWALYSQELRIGSGGLPAAPPRVVSGIRAGDYIANWLTASQRGVNAMGDLLLYLEEQGAIAAFSGRQRGTGTPQTPTIPQGGPGGQ